MAAFESRLQEEDSLLNLVALDDDTLRAKCLQVYREKIIKEVRAAFMGEVDA